jgi:hypothetical protein
VATLPPPIRLTHGQSLAQPGPEGTMTGFSIGYEFVRGEPLSSAGYVWVIRRAAGAPARIPVRLNSKGEWYKFEQWRPEEGPFQAHLEDAAGNQLSNTIDLRQ